jgi:exopolysaccharide biosynthesis polyprenyl glycosylphosphotransferase
MLVAKRVQGLQAVQLALSASGALVLFWVLLLCYVVLREQWTLNLERYVVYNVVIVGALTVDFLRCRRWMGFMAQGMESRLNALRVAFVQTMTVLLAMGFFALTFKDMIISRVFLVAYLVFLLFYLYWASKIMPKWLASRFFRGCRMQRAFIAGEDVAVDRVKTLLEPHTHCGIELTGYISNNIDTEGGVSGLQHLGYLDQLEGILAQHRPSLLVYSGLPNGNELLRLRDACENAGSRLLVAYDLEPEIARSAVFHNLNGLPIMGMHEEPLESPANRVLKRAFDIAVSLPVVLFLLPVVGLIVKIAHWRQSRGPLIFRQVRSGLHNERFVMYKFRSMHVNSGPEHQQATHGDARVFSFGKFMRRSSLDELPQFINVLLGEMSVVGPRPHLTLHDEEFYEQDRRYRMRQFAKPGITGLAQIRGFRGLTVDSADIVKRISADLDYLKHWTLTMDLTIVLRTVLHVVKSPRSAC